MFDLVLYFDFLLRLSPNLLPHILGAVGARLLIKVEKGAAVGDRLVIALTFRKCPKGPPTRHVHAGKITSKHVSRIWDALVGVVDEPCLQFGVPLGRRGTARDVALDDYGVHRGGDDPQLSILVGPNILVLFYCYFVES